MYIPQVFLIAGCVGLIGSHASAEDDFTASFRLRGGFDSNPQFSIGQGRGSAFIAADTALAAGMKADGYTLGVAAEANATHYAQPLLTPARGGKVILRGSIGDDDLKLDSTSTIADTSTYNLRSTDLIQSVRGEARYGSIKLFATAEGGRSSLNQTNAIFQDFLPDPQQYLRGTLIPGVSLVSGKSEFGASVNLSVRRYLQEFDVFGYRRHNERVQPFLFAKYADDAVTAFASVSQLRGTWHDPDFTNVNRTLFDASLTWRAAPFRIDLTAWRRAGETTFPISPITIDTAYSAKVSWNVEPEVTLAASVGYAASDYLDSPFRARTLICGVGATRNIDDDLTLGIDIAYAKGSLISGDDANGLVVTSSITKRFSAKPPGPKSGSGA
ncbi:outer membrane beta-barrel protein [Nitrobacter sp. NHB1]|uniref:outer membrane beta-barrel protein n=1 Tax=Nitrobacter sp. NHB1 TaxID=3119830 RepID=UPI002FFE238A